MTKWNLEWRNYFSGGGAVGGGGVVRYGSQVDPQVSLVDLQEGTKLFRVLYMYVVRVLSKTLTYSETSRYLPSTNISLRFSVPVSQ